MFYIVPEKRLPYDHYTTSGRTEADVGLTVEKFIVYPKVGAAVLTRILSLNRSI